MIQFKCFTYCSYIFLQIIKIQLRFFNFNISKKYQINIKKYQINIKKYQRNIKEILKKYQRNIRKI